MLKFKYGSTIQYNSIKFQHDCILSYLQQAHLPYRTVRYAVLFVHCCLPCRTVLIWHTLFSCQAVYRIPFLPTRPPGALSFGSATGCLACAVNLVNFWCALICSPDQGTFVAIHDPPYAQASAESTEPLTSMKTLGTEQFVAARTQ